MTLGDRIAVMRDGVVQQFGTPDDIYSRPATRFVAEFIGSPSMNMVGSQRNADGLHAKGIALALTPEQRSALQAANAPEITYGLRPESVAFADDGLPGTVQHARAHRPRDLRAGRHAGRHADRARAGQGEQRVGEPVFLRWSPTDAHLFDAKSEKRVA